MKHTRIALALFSTALGLAVLTTGQLRASAQEAPQAPTGPATTANISDYYDIETIALPEGDPSADGIGVMPDGRVVVSFL